MSAQAAGAAAAMDAIYRHQRFIYDATRRYYLIGRDKMIAGLDPPPGGQVLEIGCGTARNLIMAAQRYPQARFSGIDISHAMLATAQKTIARHRLDGVIGVRHADATSFDAMALFGVGQFERIFISYALSMIPDWQKVIAQATAALAQGGQLHIVDFGRMDTMPALARRAMLAWLDAFSVTPRRDLERAARDAATAHGLQARISESRLGYAAHVVIA